ncbi:MAG: Rieske 2Fe-2S domain-containing protein [Acidimicrobiales bacterium]|nr:Rieske 2Fe-2S domain-containing protein [Acidimicrobiales bacterium]
MKVPFTWKPTGWYQIGWSSEFPDADVTPLRYFGEDLVAYRGERGELHVLEAHCKHLGAHLGHGGTVIDGCVQCPFHGWQWGPDGGNVAIPDQDKPNRSRQLRVWPVMEQHGLVFLWHHPHGEPPQWEMLDIFGCYPEFDTPPEGYYPPYPAFVRKDEREPVHPQIVLENSADSAHFEFVHGASVTPQVLHWSYDEHLWYFIAGWPDTRSDDPEAMRLKIHSKLFGLGGAITAFAGSQNYRVVFSTTPIENGVSDMFQTIWWPRIPGDESDVPPDDLRERIDKEILATVEEDLGIWRYQKWVEDPAYSKIDAKGYSTLRKWSQRFYDIPTDDD